MSIKTGMKINERREEDMVAIRGHQEQDLIDWLCHLVTLEQWPHHFITPVWQQLLLQLTHPPTHCPQSGNPGFALPIKSN